MRDLLQLIREDEETRIRVASYGLSPVALEEYLLERDWHVSDPTANEAIANVMREQKARRCA